MAFCGRASRAILRGNDKSARIITRNGFENSFSRRGHQTFFRTSRSRGAAPHAARTSERGQILAVASRAERRQVTPCRVSSASGTKAETDSKTHLKLRALGFFVPRGTADNLCELNGAENTRFETRHRGRTRYGPPKSSFAPSRFRNSNIVRVSKPRRRYAQGRVKGATG